MAIGSVTGAQVLRMVGASGTPDGVDSHAAPDVWADINPDAGLDVLQSAFDRAGGVSGGLVAAGAMRDALPQARDANEQAGARAQSYMDEAVRRLQADPKDRHAAAMFYTAQDALKRIAENRERLELLEKLLHSLMLGQIPPSLIKRAAELGMGAMVSDLINSVLQSGRSLTRENAQALHGLEMTVPGLNLHVVPFYDTDDALRERKQFLSDHAIRTADGRTLDAEGGNVGATSSKSTSAPAR